MANVRGFNIQNFRSAVGRKDILRTNKFMLEFGLPPGLNGQTVFGSEAKRLDTLQSLEYWCEIATQPGLNVMTTDGVRKYGWGPVQKRPYNTSFTDLSCTFYDDGKADNWKFFFEWLKLVNASNLSRDERGIQFNKYNAQSDADTYPYEISYRDDYITDCTMYIFDNQGEYPVKTIIFREMYPTSIADAPLNWTDTDSLLKLSVNFTYLEWFELSKERARYNVTRK